MGKGARCRRPGQARHTSSWVSVLRHEAPDLLKRHGSIVVFRNDVAAALEDQFFFVDRSDSLENGVDVVDRDDAILTGHDQQQRHTDRRQIAPGAADQFVQLGS